MMLARFRPGSGGKFDFYFYLKRSWARLMDTSRNTEHVLCMAGGPGLEPVWRSGPGDPDYAASARKRVVYLVSGPNRVVRGPLRVPGLPNLGPKPCTLHVFGPKPCIPDLLVPISTPAPDLAPRPYTKHVWFETSPHLYPGLGMGRGFGRAGLKIDECLQSSRQAWLA